MAVNIRGMTLTLLCRVWVKHFLRCWMILPIKQIGNATILIAIQISSRKNHRNSWSSDFSQKKSIENSRTSMGLPMVYPSFLRRGTLPGTDGGPHGRSKGARHGAVQRCQGQFEPGAKRGPLRNGTEGWNKSGWMNSGFLVINSDVMIT